MSADPPATVFVVDDDADVRRGLERLLRSAGWQVRTFASAQDFLDGYSCCGSGCVVLDVRMPGIDGTQLHALLARRGLSVPVVFLTACGDVPTGVRAMKEGAVDFLLKPVDESALLGAIRAGLERHGVQQERQRERNRVMERLLRLSVRERQVLDRVVRGRLNKQIAADLAISEKTVKVHRAHGMEKMGVRSVAELVVLYETAGVLQSA
jgi:FixJ family two-component response regulator